MDAFECLACGPVASRDPHSPFCPACGEPLFVAPAGPGRSFREDRALALERFAEFLPLERVEPRLSLGEGSTPLLRLDRAAAGLGRDGGVFAKNEAQNPTSSFKDRGTAVAVQKAVALGAKRIGTVSTGNMAASTAAYGARAGLDTFVLLKDGTSLWSLRAAGIHSPRLVAVQGDYGAVFRASQAIGRELGIVFMNSIDPYRLEGYKLTAFEIFLQLGRRAPGRVFVPLSSGGHLLGLARGFDDLSRSGLMDGYPTVVGVQAAGCSPLADAFARGHARYERPAEVRTIAHAISNPTPPAGNAVLRVIQKRRGMIVAVTDEEMLEAQRELAAKEGLFCQPESATTLAALKKLSGPGNGGVPGAGRPGDDVLVLTGGGLKAPAALDSAPIEIHRMTLDGLEAGLARLL